MESSAFFPKPVVPGQGEHLYSVRRCADASDQSRSVYFVFEIENEGAVVERMSQQGCVRKSSPCAVPSEVLY